jgi:acetyltransferase-like isoleucine patch superfamily enzyme
MKLLIKPFAETLPYRAFHYLLSYCKFAVYGVKHGKKLRAQKVNLLNVGQIRLGDRVTLTCEPQGNVYRSSLRTYYPESVIQIGNDCVIQGTIIHCNCAVTIGDNTQLAPGVVLCDNDSHAPVLSSEARKERPPQGPITLGSNVWLGMRTIVLKGVTIGDNTIVAAGSIVTRDLPANVLAGGSPAVPKRELR